MTGNFRYLFILSYFLLVLNLVGCGNSIPLWHEPMDAKNDSLFTPQVPLMRNLPQGDDSYSQGFRDGCKTFVGIVGTGAFRTLPSKIDGYRLVQDKAYNRGWNDASNYCTFYLDWDTH